MTRVRALYRLPHLDRGIKPRLPSLLGRDERRVGRVHRDNVPTQGQERDWDHFEIGQAQRETNDGDAENGAQYCVSDRQPDARENEPEHIAYVA